MLPAPLSCIPGSAMRPWLGRGPGTCPVCLAIPRRIWCVHQMSGTWHSSTRCGRWSGELGSRHSRVDVGGIRGERQRVLNLDGVSRFMEFKAFVSPLLTYYKQLSLFAVLTCATELFNLHTGTHDEDLPSPLWPCSGGERRQSSGSPQYLAKQESLRMVYTNRCEWYTKHRHVRQDVTIRLEHIDPPPATCACREG